MIPLKCTHPFALCRISLPIHWLVRNVFILEPSLVSGRDSVHAGGNIDDQRNTSQHKIRQHILHPCRGPPNQLSCWTHQSSLCFTFLTEISWPYFIVFDDEFKRLLSAHTYSLVTVTLHYLSSLSNTLWAVISGIRDIHMMQMHIVYLPETVTFGLPK